MVNVGYMHSITVERKTATNNAPVGFLLSLCLWTDNIVLCLSVIFFNSLHVSSLFLSEVFIFLMNAAECLLTWLNEVTEPSPSCSQFSACRKRLPFTGFCVWNPFDAKSQVIGKEGAVCSLKGNSVSKVSSLGIECTCSWQYGRFLVSLSCCPSPQFICLEVTWLLRKAKRVYFIYF